MKQILIAEDNDSNYVLMSYILKKHYEFARAINGKQAVDMVDEKKFDLVLMDINMPVMDGLEASRRIRESHPELPIIAITANAFESDHQRAREAGCTDFLSKPISADVCLKTIKRILGD